MACYYYLDSATHMPSSTQHMEVFWAPISTMHAWENPAPKLAAKDSWAYLESKKKKKIPMEKGG